MMRWWRQGWVASLVPHLGWAGRWAFRRTGLDTWLRRAGAGAWWEGTLGVGGMVGARLGTWGTLRWWALWWLAPFSEHRCSSLFKQLGWHFASHSVHTRAHCLGSCWVHQVYFYHHSTFLLDSLSPVKKYMTGCLWETILQGGRGAPAPHASCPVPSLFLRKPFLGHVQALDKNSYLRVVFLSFAVH